MIDIKEKVKDLAPTTAPTSSASGIVAPGNNAAPNMPPPAPETKNKPRRGFFGRIKDSITGIFSGKSQEDDKEQPKPPMSKGEKLYKWIFYDFLNFWVNLISSVFIADYLTRDNTHGRKFLDRSIGVTAKAMSSTGLDIKQTHHVARVGLETLSLMSGGWALLPVLKIGEDHKRSIVHWLNKHVFGEKQLAADGHEMTPDEIYIQEDHSRQSWWNALKRRILASITVVSSGLVLDYALADRSGTTLPDKHYPINPYKINSTVDNDSNNWITYSNRQKGGKQRVTEFVKGHINAALGWILGDKNNPVKNENGLGQRLLDLFILDTVFTKITQLVMYVTRPGHKKEAPGEIGSGFDPIDTAVAAPLVPSSERLDDAPAKGKFADAHHPRPASKAAGFTVPASVTEDVVNRRHSNEAKPQMVP